LRTGPVRARELNEPQFENGGNGCQYRSAVGLFGAAGHGSRLLRSFASKAIDHNFAASNWRGVNPRRNLPPYRDAIFFGGKPMTKFLWIAVVAVPLSSTCQAADVQTQYPHWSDCIYAPTATTAHSCNAIIQGGQETGLALAKAYFYLGRAYDRRRNSIPRLPRATQATVSRCSGTKWRPINLRETRS
jgi:hypothetical protein